MKKINSFISTLTGLMMFAQPTTNAPIPTKLQADVISVYSDSYTTVGGTVLTPFWGQPAGYVTPNFTFNPTGVTTNPNYSYHASTLTYQGVEFNGQNLVQAGMEKLHLDVYTTNCTSLEVYIVASGTGERKVTVSPNLNGWNSYDIPLSDYSSQSNFPLTSIFQFKFVSASPSNSNVYLDNLYFWKTPLPVGTPLYGTFTIPAKENGDADFAITAPTSTSPAPITYSSSNTAVATIVSGNMIHIVGAGTSVITASQVASAPYIAGSTTANFKVLDIPTVAAPTPPTRAAVDVISMFSNAYANVAVDTWRTSWSPGILTELQVATNNTKKYSALGFVAIETTGTSLINATLMENLHIDVWTPNLTTFRVRLVDFGANSTYARLGDDSEHELSFTPTQSGWNSLDIPLSNFTGMTARNHVAQLILSGAAVPVDSGVAYIDNVYFWRTPLSTQNFSALNIKMYPNPATNMLNIEALNEIENISVYNLLGQQVISKTTNNKVVNLDIASINSGIYIIKTTIDGVVSASRFVKE